ncbi:MAG: beta/gamma crystallin-related protein [Hydrogenophaga sp.]|jgi:uncharacterized protein YcfJ|nr:beta/gamma crystallin-related protein [Hydrogenophaga sp.]
MTARPAPSPLLSPSLALRAALLAALALLAPLALAQATFFQGETFGGRNVFVNDEIRNLQRQGFRDRASSAVIAGQRWEVCEDMRFQGHCTVLRPGRYPTLASMGLDERIGSVRRLDASERISEARYAPEPAPAQLILYGQENFRGRSITANDTLHNLQRAGFNDRAESAVVLGERWEVCNDTRFEGRCVVLRPGRYPSLAAMGLDNRISSVREVAWDARVASNRYAPEPVPVYDSRPRRGERFFEAEVTSARAVLATSGQRCWVEREQLPQVRSEANVPGAIAGALIGGILGHQVGGGSGKDIATVGGVVAGAALGSQYGRNGPQPATQDVQRCENLPGGAQPAYWDVSYEFRGRQHRVQMAEAPGNTIKVNDQGEPRQ